MLRFEEITHYNRTNERRYGFQFRPDKLQQFCDLMDEVFTQLQSHDLHKLQLLDLDNPDHYVAIRGHHETTTLIPRIELEGIGRCQMASATGCLYIAQAIWKPIGRELRQVVGKPSDTLLSLPPTSVLFGYDFVAPAEDQTPLSDALFRQRTSDKQPAAKERRA